MRGVALLMVGVASILFGACGGGGSKNGDGGTSSACKKATDCNDNVACTVDICDGEGMCDHIPTDTLCTGGQVCAASGGCVAACTASDCSASCTKAGSSSGACVNASFCQCSGAPGVLKGTATYFGKTANAGITVTLVGTTLTEMTAADGTYSFASVPAGVYSMTFSAPKYLPVTLGGISVAPSFTVAAPAVTLNHGVAVGNIPQSTQGDLSFDTLYDVRYTPDRKHVAVTQFPYEGASSLFAFPTDGASAPVGLVNSSGITGTIPGYQLSNANIVYPLNSDIWTRPLTGGAPQTLATPPLTSNIAQAR